MFAHQLELQVYGILKFREPNFENLDIYGTTVTFLSHS